MFELAASGDMVAIGNVVLAVLSILFGAFGLVWPTYALGALKLQTIGDSSEGKSEIRAASGGAFVLLALAGLAFGHHHPLIWVMVGVHYAGAGAGRLLSILLDRSGTPKILAFFAVEVVFAAWLIGANISAYLETMSG